MGIKMFQILIDYALIIAFIALTLDIIIQIYHISKGKSSNDISLKGCIVRIFGAVVLQIKFFSLNDVYLIFGQTIFLSVYMIYFLLIVYYKK